MSRKNRKPAQAEETPSTEIVSMLPFTLTEEYLLAHEVGEVIKIEDVTIKVSRHCLHTTDCYGETRKIHIGETVVIGEGLVAPWDEIPVGEEEGPVGDPEV